MNKVVFILGAGASADCGAPLMNDFLETASLLHSMGRVDHKKDDFKRVFDAIAKLQAVHSKSKLDITNIESIFTTLEVARILNKFPGEEPENIPKIIASLKELIVTTLEQKITFPISNSQVQPTRTYSKFAETITWLSRKCIPSYTSSIITFNYDYALDYAMYKNSQGPIYCIGEESQPTLPTKLLKLHGSLNWASELSEDRTIFPLSFDLLYRNRIWFPPVEAISDTPMTIGAEISILCKQFDKEVSAEPLIVPPSWNKADYHQQLTSVWSAAAKELEEAEYIFIIGYSLPETDAFFKLLYALGSAGTTLLKRIVVFNPDKSGQVENRFKGILGSGALSQFSYVPMDFKGAIDNIKSMLNKAA